MLGKKKIVGYLVSIWTRIGKTIGDESYLRVLYRLRIGKSLNFEAPVTFNEKLQWLKINDRNPEYVPLVDKYEVKRIVANIIGSEYVVPTYGLWSKFDEIEFDSLPESFVLKCTHDSGGTYVCQNRKEFNLSECREKINASLARNYYYLGREWPYKNVEPRILAEKYLETEDEELVDYKFMCFNGCVKCVFTCTGRSIGDLRVDFFSRKWEHLPFTRRYPNASFAIDPPKNLKWMIESAEKLSNGFPFVRVDFYEVDGHAFFGELTFYPGCGLEEFAPEEWDEKMGSWLKLPIEEM